MIVDVVCLKSASDGSCRRSEKHGQWEASKQQAPRSYCISIFSQRIGINTGTGRNSQGKACR